MSGGKVAHYVIDHFSDKNRIKSTDVCMQNNEDGKSNAVVKNV